MAVGDEVVEGHFFSLASVRMMPVRDTLTHRALHDFRLNRHDAVASDPDANGIIPAPMAVRRPGRCVSRHNLIGCRCHCFG
jgi:hypothetical protein